MYERTDELNAPKIFTKSVKFGITRAIAVISKMIRDLETILLKVAIFYECFLESKNDVLSIFVKQVRICVG